MSLTLLSFDLEYFDEIANSLVNMILRFNLEDNTIEIFNMTYNKIFLKRIYYPDVQLHHLYIGSTLTIYSRIYTIIKYANKATEEYMKQHESHFLLICQSTEQLLNILSEMKKLQLRLTQIRTVSYDTHYLVEEKHYQEDIFFMSGQIVLECVGCHAKSYYKSFQNQVSAKKDIRFYDAIPPQHINKIFQLCKPTPYQSNCTFCLIKPHILQSNQLHDILQLIVRNGYAIEGILSLHFTLTIAHDFFSVYRNVIPKFRDMLDTIVASPCVALMISHGQQYDDSIVQDFREFCGPMYPEIAKQLYPQTIRAQFGRNLIQNAVHCTDLPEDGELECRFIFETLTSLY